MVWEVGYGYRKIKRRSFYVSSGAGTWGPPVRIEEPARGGPDQD
jgi:predicted MPP superfamily phosphohydrolase